MPKLPPRFKVFKTHLGFADYVVATSSRKAALEAWDVSQDLFKSGEAVETDDPAEIEAALAYIGKPVALAPAPRRAPGASKAKAKAKSKRARK